MLTQGSLFAGIGGFELAAIWAGMKPVWSNEREPFLCKLLRQNFTHTILEGDLRDFDYEPVDVISGGFPCQPFSHAGKRKGTEDDRFLWFEMLEVIKIARPRWVVGENVAGLSSMEQGETLDIILTSLEDEGYHTETFLIPACGVGAWHRRDRIWIIGYAQHHGFSSTKVGTSDAERKEASTRQKETSQFKGSNYTTGKVERKAGLPGSDSIRMGQSEGAREELQYKESETVGQDTGDFRKEMESYGRENKEWWSFIKASLANTNGPGLHRRPEEHDQGPIERGDELPDQQEHKSTQVRKDVPEPDSAGLKKGRLDRSEVQGSKRKGGNTTNNEPTIKERSKDVSDTKDERLQGSISRGLGGLSEEIRTSPWSELARRTTETGGYWATEPPVGRVANGVPDRVDRIKGLGNAIVPQVAYQIFKAIIEYEEACALKQ